MWELKGATFLATCPAHGAKTSLSESFKLPPEVRSKLFDEFEKVDSDRSGALNSAKLAKLFHRLALDVSHKARSRAMLSRSTLFCAFARCLRQGGGGKHGIMSAAAPLQRAATCWCSDIMANLSRQPESVWLVVQHNRVQVLENMCTQLGDERKCVTFRQLVKALEGDDDDDGDGSDDSDELTATIGDTARFATRELVGSDGGERKRKPALKGSGGDVPSAAMALPPAHVAADGHTLFGHDTGDRATRGRDAGRSESAPRVVAAGPSGHSLSRLANRGDGGAPVGASAGASASGEDDEGPQHALSLELSLSIPSDAQRAAQQGPLMSTAGSPGVSPGGGMLRHQNPAFSEALGLVDNDVFSAEVGEGRSTPEGLRAGAASPSDAEGALEARPAPCSPGGQTPLRPASRCALLIVFVMHRAVMSCLTQFTVCHAASVRNVCTPPCSIELRCLRDTRADSQAAGPLAGPGAPWARESALEAETTLTTSLQRSGRTRRRSRARCAAPRPALARARRAPLPAALAAARARPARRAAASTLQAMPRQTVSAEQATHSTTSRQRRGRSSRARSAPAAAAATTTPAARRTRPGRLCRVAVAARPAASRPRATPRSTCRRRQTPRCSRARSSARVSRSRWNLPASRRSAVAPRAS
jgi:hypothetical protein